MVDRAACAASIRSGIRLESMVRASVSADTEAAPADRSTLAHSFSVVPVVNTSSMSSTLRPLKAALRRTANARRRLRMRFARVSDVWGSVAIVRTRSVAETGRLRCRPRRSAIRRDWLNPRVRSLEECNGTGTITSGANSSGKARIVNAASGLTKPNTLRYLSAQMASCSGGE